MSTARRRSPFRPCIDLHDGQVKQIVGGTLSSDRNALKTNFIASEPPAAFSTLYKKNGLVGGHVIKLGPGNDEAAKEALAEWPGGLQVGGGITDSNASEWLEHGASKALSQAVGKDRLVIDISCRRRGDRWFVATNKWQDITDMEVCKDTLDMLADYCSEFLIHAADVEGLCRGIDEDLVAKLGEWTKIPTTYAGGAKDISDLELVDRLSNGRVDLTYGSSLDIFGGTLVKFEDLITLNSKHAEQNARLGFS